MKVVTIHFPDDLVRIAQEKAEREHYPSFSEYLRDLIRKNIKQGEKDE